MPALAADIAAGTRHAKIVEWSDPAILAAWPDARDQRSEPTPGGFDSASDAAAALAMKAALIGVARSRFAATAQDMLFLSPADDGVPSWRVVDAECGVDAVCMVGRVEIDPNSETTSVELVG